MQNASDVGSGIAATIEDFRQLLQVGDRVEIGRRLLRPEAAIQISPDYGMSRGAGKTSESIPFQITDGGVVYDCIRRVIGTRVLQQSIIVRGIPGAFENDHVSYGAKQHPIPSMEGMAKQIARELVRKHKKAPRG